MAGDTYAGGTSVVYWLIREIQKRNQEGAVDGGKIKFCPHTWTTGLGFALALQLVGVVPERQGSQLEFPLEGDWKPEYWGRFVKGGFDRDDAVRIRIPEPPFLRRAASMM